MRPTAVNLTYHPTFNLSGDFRARPARHSSAHPPPRIFLSRCRFRTHFLTGELHPGGCDPVRLSFDATARRGRRQRRTLQLALAGGYDHCWALDRGADCVAELHSPQSGITLSLLGSGPGVQFYGGQYLARAHPRSVTASSSSRRDSRTP